MGNLVRHWVKISLNQSQVFTGSFSANEYVHHILHISITPCQSICIIENSLKSVTMAHDTIVTHSLHGAGAMEKITFTLINRFQTNRRYHASLTQSLPSSVNLKLK